MPELTLLTKPQLGDLRVWHIPQVPSEPFYVPVKTPHEAMQVIETLAQYDAFQLEHNIKPDYSNASGLEEYIEVERGWGEWCAWFAENGDEFEEWAAEQPRDAHGQIMTSRDDGDRFRYWIREAASRPGRIANKIAPCIRPEQYRQALDALMDEDTARGYK